MRHWRRLAAVAAASLVVLQVGSPPARAASNQVIVGTGTMSPGIPASPTPQPQPNAYHFNGTAVGTFNNQPGTCAIEFNGTGTDSLLTGSGSGEVKCNGSFSGGGATISMSCTVRYDRTGMTLVISGQCVGTVTSSATWICQTLWTAPPPVNTFGMICDTILPG